jgi:hypothetical protein
MQSGTAHHRLTVHLPGRIARDRIPAADRRAATAHIPGKVAFFGVVAALFVLQALVFLGLLLMGVPLDPLLLQGPTT